MFSEMYVFNFTGCQQSGTEEFDGVSFRSYRKIAEEGEPVSYLEHVQVFMTVRYGHRGLVRVRVQSPSGASDVSFSITTPPLLPLMTTSY